MAEQINSLEDVKGIDDLARLQDNSQTASDMIELTKKLKKNNPDLKFTEEHVTTILTKLKNGSQTASDMIELTKKLKENNPDLKFTEEHVTTILTKLKNGSQKASDMTMLLYRNPDFKFTSEHVTTILAKLKNDLSADSVANLIKQLKQNNDSNLKFDTTDIVVNLTKMLKNNNLKNNNLKNNNSGLKFTEEHVATIWKKLKNGQHAYGVAFLIGCLKEKNPGLHFSTEHITTILTKLNNDQYASCVESLINMLKYSGVELTEGHVATILSKLKSKLENGKSVVSIAKLALSKDDVKKNENKNIIKTNSQKEKIDEKPEDRKKKYPQMLANVIMRNFEDELQILEKSRSTIDGVKKYWIEIAEELKKENILTDNDVAGLKSKINDVYAINGIWTFFQWLGCILSSLFLVPLAFAPVRNRILHPEDTRKIERLRDNKDELIAPLQKIGDCEQKI